MLNSKNGNIKKAVFTALRYAFIVFIISLLVFRGGSVTLSEEWLSDNASINVFLQLNGTVIKLLNLKDMYNDLGIYITDEKYIMSPNEWTSGDYETSQMLKLKQYLDQNEIDLYYVNLPTKYIDDELFFENFGKKTYSNQNADRFLERISSKGIKVLDLRDELKKDGLKTEECFFRTDHHWTPETALWASDKIAKSLNDSKRFNIDMTIYNPLSYTYETWKNCWVGEQGAKLSSTFTGYDDFTFVIPKFDTSFTFKDTGIVDSFNGFMDGKEYSKIEDHYQKLYYMYQLHNVYNNNVNEGKILLVCDSYSNVMEPFLALGLSETDTILLRTSNQNLIEYLEGKEYDAVVICYAQFMLGAHDDPASANYNMFNFSK